MRKLSEVEILSLASLLKMESDELVGAKLMQNLITDEGLKKQAEAALLAAEGRIKGLQQFINENKITAIEEVR